MTWREEMWNVISDWQYRIGRANWSDVESEAMHRFVSSIHDNPELEHKWFVLHQDNRVYFAKMVEEDIKQFLSEVRGEDITRRKKESQIMAVPVGRASTSDKPERERTEEDILGLIAPQYPVQEMPPSDEIDAPIHKLSPVSINVFMETLLDIPSRANGNHKIVRLAANIWAFDIALGRNEIRHLARKQSEQYLNAQAKFRFSNRKIVLCQRSSENVEIWTVAVQFAPSSSPEAGFTPDSI